MTHLTQEQKTVVQGILKNVEESQITSCGGAAGTGKTVVVTALSDILPGYCVCAYTGKAAHVLRQRGISKASTIHSLIYKPMKNGDKIEFVLKEDDEVFCDGFLCDESSMISKDLYEDLLSFNKPVIFVGDHHQLEPVGQDINLMKNPMFTLETIHRNAGEIAFFANHLWQGQPAETFPTSGKVIIADTSSVTPEAMLKMDQMICAFNKTRIAQNTRVRSVLGHEGTIEEGERIICLKNNKIDGLFNGMQGEVVRLKGKNRMDFRADGTLFYDIKYDPKQFGKEKSEFGFGVDGPNPFDYAYCITAHKSQGSEFENVMVFEQNSAGWSKNRWQYTSASRAKKLLVWVKPTMYKPQWL